MPKTLARTSIAISLIIGDVIKKLMATPKGIFASMNPMNKGIEEQEQKGVMAPNNAAKR